MKRKNILNLGYDPREFLKMLDPPVPDMETILDITPKDYWDLVKRAQREVKLFEKALRRKGK